MPPAAPVRPSAPSGLPGLWALLEMQNTLLREGRADDLPAVAAQMQSALMHVQRFAQTAAEADLLALRRMASLNLEMLRRRLLDNQAALDTLAPHIPVIAEAGARTTYAPGGRLGPPRIPGRRLGRA